MFLVIAISIAVVGLLLLAVVLGFSGKTAGQGNNGLYADKADVLQIKSDQTETKEDLKKDLNEKRYLRGQPGSGDNESVKDREYIPVLSIKIKAKGLEKEIVHFYSKGRFCQIDVEDQSVEVDKESLERYTKNCKFTEGDIFITSKWLVFIDTSVPQGKGIVKKFPIKGIERHNHIGSIAIIKRRGVKKKREIFEIYSEIIDFYYILRVLLRK